MRLRHTALPKHVVVSSFRRGDFVTFFIIKASAGQRLPLSNDIHLVASVAAERRVTAANARAGLVVNTRVFGAQRSKTTSPPVSLNRGDFFAGRR